MQKLKDAKKFRLLVFFNHKFPRILQKLKFNVKICHISQRIPHSPKEEFENYPIFIDFFTTHSNILDPK
jgi:hypothetical protein